MITLIHFNAILYHKYLHDAVSISEMLGDINVAVKDCTLSEDLTPFLLLLLDDCEEEGLTYVCRLRPIDPVTI